MRAAYIALHYGREHLAWAIRSIQDAVDEIHILYTAEPSFGHATKLTCPDTRTQLAKESLRFATKPIHWHEGVGWRNEGQHRSTITAIAQQRGISQLLCVDADEVWAPGAAAEALALAEASQARTVLVRMVHFWRSFDWMCQDPSMPTRIINVGEFEKELWYLSPQPVPVLHFGYAQSLETVRYKQDIHGHKAEWRENWFAEKFLPNPGTVGDVHPTCELDFWTPKPTPPEIRDVLSATMHDHPYYGLPVIA